MWRKANKFGAIPTTVNGIRFASKTEARRFQQLQLLVSAGEIRKLVCQPRYELQEAFTDGVGGKHRPIVYVADFSYEECDTDGKWKRVAEDVKGGKSTQTPVFKLKRKLFLFRYRSLVLKVLEDV